MSDILNHYFCGLETIHKLELEVKSKIDPSLFFLGAQGPDIFLYYNIIHFNRPISYGNAIHHKNINLFFYHFYKYISTINDERLYDKLFSYLCGFSCHHALDSITHPYIIYHSGISNKTDKNTRVYQYMHKKFEVLLDVAMLKHQYNLIANEFKIHQIFALNYECVCLLENLYKTVLEQTFHFTNANKVVKSSIKSQKVILSFLNNPENMKGKVLTSLERVLFKKSYATTAMYPKETNLDLILNLNENSWTHPCDKNQNLNSSYVKLFHDAVNRTIENIHSLVKLKNTVFNLEHIDDIFHDISYLTGKPWTSTSVSKYFNKEYADRLITL